MASKIQLWLFQMCGIFYLSDIHECVYVKPNVFYILQSTCFQSLSEVPEGHKQTQSVITTLLFVLSIITLVFTLLVYIPIRYSRM